jgi:photosystem II PsbU protein
MKKLVGVLTALFLVVSAWISVATPQAQASGFDRFNVSSVSVLAAVTERRNAADDKLSELRNKVDLNNSDVRDFRKYRGFFPSLAAKIVQNAPYDRVEDVLKIPGLSESQKERLQANLDEFVVTPPSNVFNEGDDRYNAGVY